MTDSKNKKYIVFNAIFFNLTNYYFDITFFI